MMALFEFEDGHLVPAQFGYPVASELDPELVDAVCQQVLQIVSRPLFPVTWRDVTSDGEDAPPRLTALDVTGQVVSVEILQTLDSKTLIASLSRLAEIAALSWVDLANEYPSGPEGFRVGWNKFRESMPTAAGPGPRLDHCGAGEHVPHVGDDARVLGVDDGGAARHRHHVVGPQGPQDLELAALVGGDDLPVGAPDDVVVVESPAVRLEPPALDQDDLVVAALGVAHLDAVAVRERPFAAGLAEGCPGPSRISLSVHRVKSIAWGPGRHCGAAHARGAQYSRRWLH